MGDKGIAQSNFFYSEWQDGAEQVGEGNSSTTCCTRKADFNQAYMENCLNSVIFTILN